MGQSLVGFIIFSLLFLSFSSAGFAYGLPTPGMEGDWDLIELVSDNHCHERVRVEVEVPRPNSRFTSVFISYIFGGTGLASLLEFNNLNGRPWTAIDEVSETYLRRTYSTAAMDPSVIRLEAIREYCDELQASCVPEWRVDDREVDVAMFQRIGSKALAIKKDCLGTAVENSNCEMVCLFEKSP